ncbi:hypothetical protein LRY60_02975 [Candidatus Woesebacteria bacterium]|nr:hypothetical protein [Candidatus Woesebacteria bacterium]
MRSASAAAATDYGMHVLRPEEIETIAAQTTELRQESSAPLYVTLPFSLDDTKDLDRWRTAFRVAKENNIVPLVRLVTRFDTEANAWAVPSQYEIVQLTSALNQLEWPQTERHVILFNEPNHAAEWGGTTDPESYASISYFAAQWLNTESENYVVLPAAADLAAPNGPVTMEAFTFWKRALAAEPDLLYQLDAWNSHSYPNPGFVAAPTRTGQNSLRGFEHELAFLDQYQIKEWKVYITETGWRQTPTNARSMAYYYEYAHENIWNHSQVVAVTPFLWQGAPGPFAEFSLQNEAQSLTYQGEALFDLIAQSAAVLLTDSAAASGR